jgi:hypothetical protein
VLDRLADAVPVPEQIARDAGKVDGDWSPL